MTLPFRENGLAFFLDVQIGSDRATTIQNSYFTQSLMKKACTAQWEISLWILYDCGIHICEFE
jgi:hypothetical protein